MSRTRELEFLLYEHPAVRDLAILEENSERLAIFVQPRSGKQLDCAELALFCRQINDSPKEFYVVNNLPKTKTGKIYREALLELLPKHTTFSF